MSLHVAFICLPEGLAFAFGLLSDATDVLGYRKRFYIVLAALIQILMSLVVTNLADVSTLTNGELLFSFCVAMIVLARTVLSPVVDSLMIIQMKRDKVRGSEDLETFAHVFEAMGSIFFSIFGGILVT